jgi:GAF domain-containing protein
MLARGHRLEMGQGIVGYVAKTGIHRIALDVGVDSIYFNNPDLPTTRSEMALPLKIRNAVIGILDVQSEMPRAFTEIDARNLSILTDQVAIALENAQLFERTQQALNEAQLLYRQNLKAGWMDFGQEEEIVGYHQTIKGGERLKETIETAEIREAINRGTSLYFNTDGEKESYIVVPVKLRGQVIGTLDIKAPTKDRLWTSDEINFAEAVSERLSIALENARLIQASQRQVMKQQTIRDVTEKISSSINLKNVLQSAVEELGRVMPGSEVILKLSQKDSNKQDQKEE